MPVINNSESERMARRVNRILYAEYLTGQTAFQNGVIPTPPTFKGNYTFFLKMKQGIINTEPSEQTRFILNATPAPTPHSALSISIPRAGLTYITVNWPASARATSYSYVLNGAPYTPTIDNGLSGSITLEGLAPGTPYTLVVTESGPSGTSTSPPVSIYTLPIAPLFASFTPSAQTQTGFTIGWSGAAGVTRYSYRIINTEPRDLTAADGIIVTDNGLSGNSVSFAGLRTASQYSVIVTAHNPSGSQSSLPYTIFTAPAQPSISTTATTVACGTVTGGSGTVTTPALPGGNLAYTYTLTDSSTTPPTTTTVSVGSPSGGISVTEVGTPPVATFTGLTPGRSYTTTTIGSVSCGTATSTSSSVTPPPIPGAITPYIYTLVNTSVIPNTIITVSAGSPSGGISVVEVGTPPVATFTGLVVGNIYTVNAAGSVTGGTTSSASPSVSVPRTYTVVDSSTTPPTTITVAPGRPSGGISVTEAGTPPVGTFTGLLPSGSYAVSTPSSVSCGIATSGSPSVNVPNIPGGTQPYTYTLVDSSTTPPTTLTVSVGNASGGISVTESGTPPVATFTGLLSGRFYSVSATTSASCGTATSVSSSVNVPALPTVTAPASPSVTVPSSFPPPYTYILTDSSTTPPTTTVLTALTSPVGGISLTESSGPPPVGTFTGLVNGRSYSVSATGSALPSAGITSQGFSLALPPATGGTPPLSYTYSIVNTSTTPSTTTTITAANSPQNGITVTESGTPRVATFTGLAGGAAYTVSISITDGAGTNSPASTPAPFATLPGPAAPVNGTIAGLGSFTATVPFTTPGSGSTPVSYSYTLVANGVTTIVTGANSPQNGITVTESAGPPRTAVFTGLAANTAYSVVVNSIDKYGTRTPSSSFTVTTLLSSPTTPTSLAFPTIGNTTALLTWSAGDYATSYNFVVTNTTSGSIVNPTIVTYLMNGSLAPNSATISGLLAGVSYSVTVQAVNSFASSSVSTAASFTTTSPLPITVNTSAITPKGFTVNWTGGTSSEPNNTNTYLTVATPSTGKPVTIYGTSPVVFTGLSVATDYTIVVTETDLAETTTTSAPVTATTLANQFGVPDIFLLSCPNNTTCQVCCLSPSPGSSITYNISTIDLSGNVLDTRPYTSFSITDPANFFSKDIRQLTRNVYTTSITATIGDITYPPSNTITLFPNVTGQQVRRAGIPTLEPPDSSIGSIEFSKLVSGNSEHILYCLMQYRTTINNTLAGSALYSYNIVTVKFDKIYDFYSTSDSYNGLAYYNMKLYTCDKLNRIIVIDINSKNQSVYTTMPSNTDSLNINPLGFMSFSCNQQVYRINLNNNPNSFRTITVVDSIYAIPNTEPCNPNSVAIDTSGNIYYLTLSHLIRVKKINSVYQATERLGTSSASSRDIISFSQGIFILELTKIRRFLYNSNSFEGEILDTTIWGNALGVASCYLNTIIFYATPQNLFSYRDNIFGL